MTQATFAESVKRGHAAGLATRREMAKSGTPGIATNYVEWHIPLLERVTAQQFEQLLVEQFGPEYLEPFDYHWVDGVLVPIKTANAQNRPDFNRTPVPGHNTPASGSNAELDGFPPAKNERKRA